MIITDGFMPMAVRTTIDLTKATAVEVAKVNWTHRVAVEGALAVRFRLALPVYPFTLVRKNDDNRPVTVHGAMFVVETAFSYSHDEALPLLQIRAVESLILQKHAVIG